MEWVSLGIALWGAVLSTLLVVARRRRRLLLSAAFDRFGSGWHEGSFVVTAFNLGERSLTIRDIELEIEPGKKFSLARYIDRLSKGTELPVQVEPDEEVRALFDVEVAVRAIAGSPEAALNVEVAGRKREWRLDITERVRHEADEIRQLISEEEDEIERQYAEMKAREAEEWKLKRLRSG
jgi:hypothetical protein